MILSDLYETVFDLTVFDNNVLPRLFFLLNTRIL